MTTFWYKLHGLYQKNVVSLQPKVIFKPIPKYFINHIINHYGLSRSNNDGLWNPSRKLI